MEPIRSSDLDSPQARANPYPLLARLRAEAPVMRISVPYWKSAWLVTRYQDVLTVLKDERFAKDISPRLPWMPDFAKPLDSNMLNRDAPDHTRLRALVNKAFTPRLVERLGIRIQEICDGLTQNARRVERVELVGEYALPIPLTIIAELLGIPAHDRMRFYSWTRGVMALTSSSRTDVVLGLPGTWRFLRYLRKLCTLRRIQPQDDLVTALVRAEEAGDRLSQDELLGMVVLLLLAGFETTVHLIACGALALIQHPEQLELLQQNPALAESAIEELLRFTSPVMLASPRLTRQDVTIASVRIPRGELAVAVLGSANRDESVFPNADTLHLTRTPNDHLAFAEGRHFCLGAALARLEGRIALTTLFRAFPKLRLAVAPETLRWRRSRVFRGLEELPLVIDRRAR